MKPATTLLELLESHADGRTAIVVPETNTRVTYDSLRRQVLAMAEALAGAGIGRDDRVAIALPNGLQAIVAFLTASLAGTAAPMNQNYRSEEFRFYLEDTAARLLICPPTGAEEAREAARGRVPVLSVAQDASGAVYLESASKRAAVNAPSSFSRQRHLKPRWDQKWQRARDGSAGKRHSPGLSWSVPSS
jgi:acyl-CoA synthetase (AMP-forming)/AMP-acid ligase II